MFVSTERVLVDGPSNPVNGVVQWAPVKSIWLTGMTLVAVLFGPFTFSAPSFLVFVVLTAVTICCGHSVGMHRLLIHRSFRANRGVEYLFVYLGVLVGMAGPFGMIRLHDFRDWGQRQNACHDFFSHRGGFWRDAWWQLHCRIELSDPPRFEIERAVAIDRYYQFLERTWMWQQFPVGIILYVFGGINFVVWGIAVRVSVSLIGHWLVGYFAHQPREQVLHVQNACVQGYNLPKLGLITFGEAFHENHHAFPTSAKLGIFPGQTDPGWWLILGLKTAGLVSDVQMPNADTKRAGVVVLNDAIVGPDLADFSLQKIRM